MTQRNPMNDRYQTDEHQGQTRKSAASAKPKTKAAASVRIQPTQKTKQQKKAERKAEKKAARAQQAATGQEYYTPPTEQYKRARRMYWGLLIGAIALTALSFLGNGFLPLTVTYVGIGLAYGCIIGALYIDFAKVRKIRKAYQEEMAAHKSKEQRALQKQQKAALRAQKQEAAEKYEEAKTAEAEEPKKRGLFGSGFRLGKAEEAKAEKQAAKAAKKEDAAVSSDAVAPAQESQDSTK